MSNAYMPADSLAVPTEAKQGRISLSGATPGSLDLTAPRKVIWIFSNAEIYLNVSNGANPGDLTADAGDLRRHVIPANAWYPLAQNSLFDTVWAAIVAGSGTAQVLISIGAEVIE